MMGTGLKQCRLCLCLWLVVSQNSTQHNALKPRIDQESSPTTDYGKTRTRVPIFHNDERDWLWTRALKTKRTQTTYMHT